VPKSQDRPGQVFEFVLDLDRYRQEDHRVGRVGPVKRDGSGGTAVSSGRIGGLPEPSGTYPFTLTPTSQRFRSAIAGPARWFIDLEGSFERKETGDGPAVVHPEVFAFKRPWRRSLDPLPLTWLERHDPRDGPLQKMVEGG